ncbi:MAG: acetyltransferase [Lachnospiraceae bacterium]|nr:acetyltransferase [Lachnospiraceae bacterium]
METKLLLIGGGGHCRSVLECLMSMRKYSQIGIVDNNKSVSASGISVVGNDGNLPELMNDGWTSAFITVGSIGSTVIRRRLYQLIKNLGFQIPIIIDPTAIVANDVEIKEGVFIGKRTVINAGSKIGNCAIINTGSIVEHDCCIGDFSHISPGTTICGQVLIGNDTHVGAGAVVRQGITIGGNTLIGVGSVVVKDIPGHAKAYGNPCKVIE